MTEAEGVLVVDKPVGPTSHDVVAVARRALGLRRVGHTGTLDPTASGVLVLCVGRATRLVETLQDVRKTYVADMVIGRETTTQDADGEVVSQADASGIDESQFCRALTGFMGSIEQVPPMVSAVKVDGERLHVKARRGEVVDRPSRTVTVHDLVLESFTPGAQATATFLITCSSGTYVRTIAHDVGAKLGVGGSLTGLRRMANGPFTVDEALSLDDVERLGAERRLRSRLINVREAVERVLPTQVVPADVALALSHGKKALPEVEYDKVALVCDDRLVGVYKGGGEPRALITWARPEDFLTNRAAADRAATDEAGS